MVDLRESWKKLVGLYNNIPYQSSPTGKTENRRPIIFGVGRSPEQRVTYLSMPRPSDGGTAVQWAVYTLQLKNMLTPNGEWLDCGIIDVVIDRAQFPKELNPIAIVADCRTRPAICLSSLYRQRSASTTRDHKTVELVCSVGPWAHLKQLVVGHSHSCSTGTRAQSTIKIEKLLRRQWGPCCKTITSSL